MAHIHLDGLVLDAGDGSSLFAPLTQTISNEVVGLFGRNGGGKSSLLSAIAGGRAISSGSMLIDGTVGLMEQSAFEPGVSLLDALGVTSALQRIARIEAGKPLANDLDEADWELPSRLERFLADFDLSGFALDNPAAALSGGEQRRVRLAAVLLQQPDILLLDEPTNDLDDKGRAMVTDLLARWDGPALVASHDRALLEGMDRIIELSPAGCLSVSGGWSVFKAQRDAARERAQEALTQAKDEARQVQAAHQARSERQARRAKQGKVASARRDDTRLEINARKSQAEKTSARDASFGQERVTKASEAVKVAAAQVERVVPIRIELPPSGLQRGHRLVEARRISFEVDGRRLFGPLDFTVTGPERIALTGAN
ncbi:MAG: ABC-F family ATP-binding cassette domain-containing protein, partial [Erythrobacter sp.]|nr:ABC-F family ATP-binding cassette domain-containing protein [Erythrobacter sp.]